MNKLLFINILIKLTSFIKSISFDLHTTKSKQNFRNLDSTIFGGSHTLYYYYANLYLGKKGIKQSYILDTGSSITTSPCELCKECGKHKNKYFKINNENIIKCNSDKCNMVKNNCNNDLCSFQIYYAEGSSLKGIYINEIVRFGDNFNNTNYYFIPIGCTTKETHLFKTRLADGIMGLSNSNINFVSLLKDNGIIKNNIFSLCLAQNGGYFSIDEIQYKYHLSSKINYFKIPNSEFYDLEISNITILNEVITVNTKAIIDSGTTYTYFPSFYGNKITNKINEICNNEKNKNKCGKYKELSNYGSCYSFNNKKEIIYALDNIFPNITFIINGNIKYIWRPYDYYFNISNTICLGFTEMGNRFILGSTWMRGHDIIFNRENFTIGFVEADCNKGINYNIKDLDDKINEDNCYGICIRNFGLLYFFLFILGILFIISIIFIISINKLRKGKKFLFFQVEDNQLKIISNENIEMNIQKKIGDKYNLLPE